MVTKFLKKKIAIALVAAMAIGGVTPTKLVPSFKMENVKAAASQKLDVSFDTSNKILNVGYKSGKIALGSTVYYQVVGYTTDKNGVESVKSLSAKGWVPVEIGLKDSNGYVGYVDFSWLKYTTKQDLCVMLDPTDSSEKEARITLNAMNTTLKIKYFSSLTKDNGKVLDSNGTVIADDCYIGNDTTGYLVSENTVKVTKVKVDGVTTNQKDIVTAAIPFDDLEFKTAEGDWTSAKDSTSGVVKVLAKNLYSGIKLQFRVAATEETVVGKEVTVSYPAKSTTLKIKFFGELTKNGTKVLDSNETEIASGCYIGNDVTGYLVSENTVKVTKVKVDGVTTNQKDIVASAIPFANLEFKTTDGNWTSATDPSLGVAKVLARYVNKGVKLQFRVAATSETPAGKTIAFSYPAKASGPKVTVDYNKQMVTLPVGSQYILSDSYKVGAAWINAPTELNSKGKEVAKAVYFNELDETIGYDGDVTKVVYVRTPGSKAKVSSKITVVTLGKATETASGVINVANGTTLLPTSYTAATDGKVLIQYATPYIATTTAKGKTTSTIAITNNSTEAYQVAVVLKSDLKDASGNFYNGNDFTAAASRIKIGDSASVIKFTDVKGYTVNKTGVKVAGTAKIATTLASEKSVSDYVILYRQFNKSSKTNTAPGKIYMVNMPEVLTQTLTANQGNTSLRAYVAGATPTITVNGNSEFTLSLGNIVNTATKPTVTVCKEAECKNANKDITVKVTKDGNNAKLTWIVNKEDNKDTGAYVKVVWESVTQYYYIGYSKTNS